MNFASNMTRIIIPILKKKRKNKGAFTNTPLKSNKFGSSFFFFHKQTDSLSPQLSTLLVLVPVQVGGASLCYPLNSFSSPSFQIYKYICIYMCVFFFFNAAGLFSILCTIDPAFF